MPVVFLVKQCVCSHAYLCLRFLYFNKPCNNINTRVLNMKFHSSTFSYNQDIFHYTIPLSFPLPSPSPLPLTLSHWQPCPLTPTFTLLLAISISLSQHPPHISSLPLSVALSNPLTLPYLLLSLPLSAASHPLLIHTIFTLPYNSHTLPPACTIPRSLPPFWLSLSHLSPYPSLPIFLYMLTSLLIQIYPSPPSPPPSLSSK